MANWIASLPTANERIHLLEQEHSQAPYDPAWLWSVGEVLIPVAGTVSLILVAAMAPASQPMPAQSIVLCFTPIAISVIVASVAVCRERLGRPRAKAVLDESSDAPSVDDDHCIRFRCEGKAVELADLVRTARKRHEAVGCVSFGGIWVFYFAYLVLAAQAAVRMIGAPVPQSLWLVPLTAIVAAAVLFSVLSARYTRVSGTVFSTRPVGLANWLWGNHECIDLRDARVLCKYKESRIEICCADGRQVVVRLTSTGNRHRFVHALFQAAASATDGAAVGGTPTSSVAP